MSGITSVTSANGLFTMSVDGGSSKQYTFAEAVMLMGMASLQMQDQYFEAQFKKSQDSVEESNKVNQMISLLTNWKTNFDANGGAISNNAGSKTHVTISDPEQKKLWDTCLNDFVKTGKIRDGGGSKIYSKENQNYGIGNDYCFSHTELTGTLSSAEAYQKNLSSLNEQQMMVTNQAISRRSTVLQQLQTLLGSVKEGLQAAAR